MRTFVGLLLTFASGAYGWTAWQAASDWQIAGLYSYFSLVLLGLGTLIFYSGRDRL
jgi:hypothetical protein